MALASAVCPNLVPEIFKGVRVFSWEDDILGKEAVPESVEADSGFPLLRLWPRGVGSVRPVGGLLSFARHGPRVLLICVASDGYGPSVESKIPRSPPVTPLGALTNIIRYL